MNRHIVDQLADVREQIKLLKEQEEFLKNKIVSMGQNTVSGDEYVATASLGESSRLDRAKVEAAMGTAWVRKHLSTSKFITVRLTRKAFR